MTARWAVRTATRPAPQSGSNSTPRSFSFTNRGRITVTAVPVYNHFLCAAHPSLQVVQLWTASEVREPAAWERALPSPLPRFFEKNRVKLFYLHPVERKSGYSAGFRVFQSLFYTAYGFSIRSLISAHWDRVMRSSRGLEPSCGPTIPRSSSSSISRAALA